MQLVEQHIIKKSSKEYKFIDEMSFKSKNLYNSTLYAVRQHYFKTKEYLNYYSTQKLFQNSKQPDYQSLPSKVSQWVMRMVDQNFKSFFNSIKTYNENHIGFTGRPKLPNYLNKENGRYLLTFTNQAISKKLLDKQGLLKISGLDNVLIKTKLTYDQINQVRIVPRNNSHVIEIIYSIPDKN